MEKYYYYIDYGLGFVSIDPNNNQLKLAWVRGELNDFISRKQLSGSFAVISTNAVDAENYYIQNGNIEASFRIYQNGDISTGTLIYEGFATTQGLFDYDNVGNAISCTFNSFRTNDIYSQFIDWWTRKISKSDIVNNSGINNPNYISGIKIAACFENENSIINKIQAYSFDGTNFAQIGNTLNLPTLGRIAAENISMDDGTVVFIDTYTSTLRTYQYVAPNWTNPIPDYQVSNSIHGNWSLTVHSTKAYLIAEDGNYFELALSGGVWSLFSSEFLHETFRYPSSCDLDGIYYAFIDDSKGSLQARQQNVYRGEPFEISGVKKPKICTLDPATLTIAMIDEATGKLRALRYSGLGSGTWSELGFLQLTPNYEPNISYSSPNNITYQDPYTGTVERYSFDGTSVWTKTGNSLSVGGLGDSYSQVMPTSIITGSEVMASIRSGSMVYFDSAPYNIVNYFNKLIGSIQGVNFQYGINKVSNGSTVNLNELSLMDLSTLQDNNYEVLNYFKDKSSYSLQDLLNVCELFQQYFYIDISADSPIPYYDIKFIQPNLFSSIGTDIIVPSEAVQLLRSRLYKEGFKINFEKLEFKNEFNTDFIGDIIEYSRNTDIQEVAAYNYTMDARFVKDSELGILKSKYDKSGFLVYQNTTTGTSAHSDLVPKGFIFGSGTNYIENSNYSKARIMDNYYKDYRYSNKGVVIINGITYDPSTFNTCRDIIEYPDVELTLASFPTSIANLDWGGGDKSFITELSLELETDEIIIKSRKLDL